MFIVAFLPAFLVAGALPRPAQKWVLGGLVMIAGAAAVAARIQTVTVHPAIKAIAFLATLIALFVYLVRTRQVFGMRDIALWSFVGALIAVQILLWSADISLGGMIAIVAALAVLAWRLGATREYWRLGDPRRAQPQREG